MSDLVVWLKKIIARAIHKNFKREKMHIGILKMI